MAELCHIMYAISSHRSKVKRTDFSILVVSLDSILSGWFRHVSVPSLPEGRTPSRRAFLYNCLCTHHLVYLALLAGTGAGTTFPNILLGFKGRRFGRIKDLHSNNIPSKITSPGDFQEHVGSVSLGSDRVVCTKNSSSSEGGILICL